MIKKSNTQKDQLDKGLVIGMMLLCILGTMFFINNKNTSIKISPDQTKTETSPGGPEHVTASLQKANSQIKVLDTSISLLKSELTKQKQRNAELQSNQNLSAAGSTELKELTATIDHLKLELAELKQHNTDIDERINQKLSTAESIYSDFPPVDPGIRVVSAGR